MNLDHVPTPEGETREQFERRIASYAQITPEQLRAMRPPPTCKADLVIDCMLDESLNTFNPLGQRIAAARTCLPFLKPVLKAVEVDTDETPKEISSEPLSNDEWTQRHAPKQITKQ